MKIGRQLLLRDVEFYVSFLKDLNSDIRTFPDEYDDDDDDVKIKLHLMKILYSLCVDNLRRCIDFAGGFDALADHDPDSLRALTNRKEAQSFQASNKLMSRRVASFLDDLHRKQRGEIGRWDAEDYEEICFSRITDAILLQSSLEMANQKTQYVRVDGIVDLNAALDWSSLSRRSGRWAIGCGLVHKLKSEFDIAEGFFYAEKRMSLLSAPKYSRFAIRSAKESPFILENFMAESSVGAIFEPASELGDLPFGLAFATNVFRFVLVPGYINNPHTRAGDIIFILADSPFSIEELIEESLTFSVRGKHYIVIIFKKFDNMPFVGNFTEWAESVEARINDSFPDIEKYFQIYCYMYLIYRSDGTLIAWWDREGEYPRPRYPVGEHI